MLSMCRLCLPFPLKHLLSLPPCGKNLSLCSTSAAAQNVFVGEQPLQDPVAPG